MNIRAAEPGDAAGIARVHVNSWRTTYPSILPAAVLASLSYQRRETAWVEILARQEGQSGSRGSVRPDRRVRQRWSQPRG
jgi:hypothetical protein